MYPKSLDVVRKIAEFLGLALLILSFSSPTFAATLPASNVLPGTYCPGPEIKLIIAEELTSSLDLAMHSRSAMLAKNQAEALSDLTSVATALHLAASRGAGARTAELIDAIIQSSHGEAYKQMLEWLPLLYTSLQTLQDENSGQVAKQLIEHAEAIMTGEKEGNPIQELKQARHMLSCDGLFIPIEQAKQAQMNLYGRLERGLISKSSDYDTLLDSLRTALQNALAVP